MKQLLEDYKRRLETINKEIKKFPPECPEGKYVRYTTKISCYKTIISELERELSKVPDLSYAWHCAEDVMSYKELIKDAVHAKSLAVASTHGFRFALRKMEDLELITMGDIDRNPNAEDVKKFEQFMNTN